HVLAGLWCWQRRTSAPRVGGNIVDGILGDMNACCEAAGNIYLPVPVGALDIAFGGGHIGELCPSLRCRTPAPKVIEVAAGGGLATVDVRVGSIGRSTSAVSSTRSGCSRAPRPRCAPRHARRRRRRCWRS